jgi:hypothetical protein
MKSLELVFDLVRFMLSVVLAVFLVATVITGALWTGCFINNILIWVLG